MHFAFRYARARQPEIEAAIEQMVRCESPSDAPAEVNRFIDLLVEMTRDVAKARVVKSRRFGSHLRLDFTFGRAREAGRILAVGHSDTVWPRGTLQSMPFKKAKGRLWGPGVLDMKAGIAFFLFAVRALLEEDVMPKRKVSLWVVSDEEMGSPESRAFTESEAKKSECVLVLEPGTGPTGKLKTARKGIAIYKLAVQGRASHAGVDFAKGASAVVELARQVERVAVLTDLARGVTVNPGVIVGGTRSNVVAAEAFAEVDVRVERLRDAKQIDKQMRALKPFDKRCQLAVEGGLNRPPMERTAAIGRLFGVAQEIGRELDVELEESATGGGSDGNFTAALGVPTLDGLGAVGEGAHAANESILVDRIPDRVALLTGLISRL